MLSTSAGGNEIVCFERWTRVAANAADLQISKNDLDASIFSFREFVGGAVSSKPDSSSKPMKENIKLFILKMYIICKYKEQEKSSLKFEGIKMI